MSFGCKVGDSVFLPDDGGVHRYVVLTNPNKDDGIVIVNFTSAPNPMCDGKVFTRSDNRNLFVKPTVVHYKRAIIISKYLIFFSNLSLLKSLFFLIY